MFGAFSLIVFSELQENNIKNDRIESNIYSLINNYDCQETIHMFYRNDIINYSNSNINNIDNTNNSLAVIFQLYLHHLCVF